VLELCDADRRFRFLSIKAPSSSNAGNWRSGWFIVGDAAYRSGDAIAVSWPGVNLDEKKANYNFWQSSMASTSSALSVS
jgi:hypothetical protein